MSRNKTLQGRPITFFFSSFRAGGGERVMVTLANATVAEGHPVEVVVLKGVGEYKKHFHQDISIVDFDVWRMIFSLPKLIYYLLRTQPCVMIATDEYTHILLLTARFFSRVNTRVVLRIGNIYSELYRRHTGIKHAITFWMIQRIYKYADAIIVNSKGVADDIAAIANVDVSKVKVIYNPKALADIRRYGDEKTGIMWLDDKTLPIVMSVGRLREQKNLSVLLHAFAHVVQNIPVRLVLVGAGREEGALRSLVEELGISESVTFTGYQENPYAFMAKADVYVLPSLWEGMPNALMEAMVCGLPVIAADCNSGPRELLAPESDHKARLKKGLEQAPFGILVAVNDQDALEHALTTMLSDEALRARYRKKALERAESFDQERVIKQYLTVLMNT